MAASYKHAIRWIAANDEPGEIKTEIIEGFISTLLIADIFGKPSKIVAGDIWRLRMLKRCSDGIN